MLPIVFTILHGHVSGFEWYRFSLLLSSKTLAMMFRQLAVFQHRLDSPQVKRDLISTKINFVYDLPQRLLQHWVETRPTTRPIFQKWVFGIPFSNEFMAIAVKDYTKADIKISCSCLILLDFFYLLQIFYPQL